MLQEQWTQWKPVENLAKDFFVKWVKMSNDNFKILFFSDETPTRNLLVTFKHPVLFYKSTDETCAQETICDIKRKHGKEFIQQCPFFKATDSLYINWLIDESCTTLDKKDLLHFIFFEINSLIDVITTGEPLVEWI